jgi:hypothetical protein
MNARSRTLTAPCGTCAIASRDQLCAASDRTRRPRLRVDRWSRHFPAASVPTARSVFTGPPATTATWHAQPPARLIPLMWFFRRRLFGGPFWPVGLVFAAYRVWRHLPQSPKREIRRRARVLMAGAQRR